MSTTKTRHPEKGVPRIFIISLQLKTALYISGVENLVSLVAAGFTEELIINRLNIGILMRFSQRKIFIILIKT